MDSTPRKRGRPLKDAKDIYRELNKQASILSNEEEKVFKDVADRLNIEYEQHLENEQEKAKKIFKSIRLDETTLTFAYQTMLIRAILSNNISYKEGLSEFVKNLILEEWKRQNSKLESIQNDVDREIRQTKSVK